MLISSGKPGLYPGPGIIVLVAAVLISLPRMDVNIIPALPAVSLIVFIYNITLREKNSILKVENSDG
jgi:hypothetical protein